MVNSMYDAFRNTYAPTFPPDLDCGAGRPLHHRQQRLAGGYIWFTAASPSPSSSTRRSGRRPASSSRSSSRPRLLKLLPFSIGAEPAEARLGGHGPDGHATSAGGTTATAAPATTSSAMTYADFDSQCVQRVPGAQRTRARPRTTTPSPRTSSSAALAHGDETYEFRHQGIDPQFAAPRSPPTTVIADGQQPGPTTWPTSSTSTRTLSGRSPTTTRTTTDTIAAPKARTCTASGMLTLEWANLVQQYMQQTATA